MNPVFFPALGALAVLAFDLFTPLRGVGPLSARSVALSGIRLGSLAVVSLAAVAAGLRWTSGRFVGTPLARLVEHVDHDLLREQMRRIIHAGYRDSDTESPETGPDGLTPREPRPRGGVLQKS